MSNYNGLLSQEIEYTIYAKLPDLSILEQAPVKETHEQWQLPLAKEGQVKARLRLINDRQYTMTTKAKRPGMAGWEEVDATIPEALFKHLREMAINGYKKTRYVFPVTGTDRHWEIDVFMDKSGNPHPWVKIDVEVKDRNEKLPIIDLDLGATEFIIEGHHTCTKEDEAMIEKLWTSEWQQIDMISLETPTK